MPLSPIQALRQQYLRNETDPLTQLNVALANSNSNASHNVYLAQDHEWSRNEATKLNRANIDQQPLWGIPISLKDLFDLASFPTSAGSLFYRNLNGPATLDSIVATRLRKAGAIITGKTHLHQLAYGITGENPDFADCVQPSNAQLLTGGSSSGAAASVQEGSALAAIGTDTGGSIRVPAALCGLAGFRSSITRTHDLAAGCVPLAHSFDTFGWLYRDLRDGPILAQALFNLEPAAPQQLDTLRIGMPQASFLNDCESDVLETFRHWQHAFQRQGTTIEAFDSTYWNEAFSIYAPIQSHEAALYHQQHAGTFAHFAPTIADRLAAGLKLTDADIAPLREKHREFQHTTLALFQHFDYLLLPASPTSRLLANADHSQTRTRILRYTAPMSVAGLPVVTLRGGMQLVAPLGNDAELLALSSTLGAFAPLSHQSNTAGA